MIALLVALQPGCTVPVAEPLPAVEVAAREALATTPIRVAGIVMDPDGVGVVGASVRVGTATTTTDRDGSFAVDGLARTNTTLVVEATGYHPERIAVALRQPVVVDAATVGMLTLRPRVAGQARLLFGGDTAFGRRMLDPDGSTPNDAVPPPDPNAAVQSTNPFDGSFAALAGVVPWLADADWAAVNLESAVTSAPDTPHEAKSFVMFTLPESLDALAAAGVDYLSLGNNHVYDYLDAGLSDTLANAAASGLAAGGAGDDPDAAWATVAVDAADLPLTLVSATSVRGDQHDITYVATEDQGGAADLYDATRLTNSITDALDAGRTPVAFLHSGTEYARTVSDASMERFQNAVVAGAPVVVSTHPHIAQGFHRYAGGLIAESLGNFVFDQDRLETMPGWLLQVDLGAGGDVGAIAQPILLENYQPQPMVWGDVANALIRRAAETSTGLAVVPWNGRALLLAPEQVATVDREVDLDYDVPYTRQVLIDLRDVLLPGESVAKVAMDRPGLLRVGRDILEHGGMEDEDADDDDGLQLARWDLGSAGFGCVHGPRRGTTAICLDRGTDSEDDAVVTLRNRVRVWGDAEDDPHYDQTVLGYLRGDDAGDIAVELTWLPTTGSGEFETLTVGTHPGGTTDWTRFSYDLPVPSNELARAMRLVLREAPPDQGAGLAVVDDLAIVAWEDWADAAAPLALVTPHARDFVRTESDPGPLRVTLTLRSTAPLLAP